VVSPVIQLRRAWGIVRQDRNYRRFIALRASLMVAGAALPFLAVYVKQELGGPPEVIGIYLGIYTFAALVTNVFFLWGAGRIGNRWIMVLACASGLIMMLVAAGLVAAAGAWGISGWAAAIWLLPVFALSGFRDSAIGVAGQPLLMDIAPRAERTLYLGFTNSLSGVLLLSTSLSGVVVATLGLPVLLALTVLAYGLALVAALRVREAVPEPPAPAQASPAVTGSQSAR
jgi:MFS family permease